MMKFTMTGVLLTLISFSFQPAGAQQHTFRYRNDIKIVIDGDTLINPWAGGINSPVFSKIDLDLDGTEDLFVFDRTHQKSYTFLARAHQGAWQWQYAPAYEYLFPSDLSGWVLLRDYDRDGRRDIFTHTNLGIKVYRNTSSPAGPLAFAQAQSFLTYDNNYHLHGGSENLPAIGDMDQDGDLDVLTFHFATSTTIEYYQNLQQQEGLAADKLKYTRLTGYWGGLGRCHSHACHAYVFGGACRTSGTRHNTGATLLTLDLDGDGDQDMLTGGESCPELVKITNSGTATQERLTGADVQMTFPDNTTPAIGNAFPAAYYEDVSFDGLPDLLVAPFARDNAGGDSDFSRSSWYYQQTGSTPAPGFVLRRKDFLQQHMIDAGEQSAPALADVDADGDADLLLGTRQGSIWFFRNVGTAAKAIFHLESRDYLHLSAAGYQNIKPSFADLNGNGGLDLVLAATLPGGSVMAFLPNTAAFGQPAEYALSQLQSLKLQPAAGGAPTFYDLDGDGDQDLVLASTVPPSLASGALQFYRNTGSPGQPAFTLAQDNWGGIALEFKRRNSFPLLADLNRDNKPELLLADDTGELRIYSNILADLNATFTPVTDILSLPGSTEQVPLRLGGSITLAAADLDGDHLPELVAGSQGGGLVLLNQAMTGTPPAAPVDFALYPNPADTWLKVVSDEEVILSIINAAGQEVKAFGSTFRKIHEVDVSALSPGLYLVQVRTAARKQTAYKLVIGK